MIHLSRQHQAQVLLLAVPRPSLMLTPPGIYQQLSDETNTPINMTVLPEVLGNNKLKSDTYHPNASGYKTMAEEIFHQLQESGALI